MIESLEIACFLKGSFVIHSSDSHIHFFFAAFFAFFAAALFAALFTGTPSFISLYKSRFIRCLLLLRSVYSSIGRSFSMRGAFEASSGNRPDAPVSSCAARADFIRRLSSLSGKSPSCTVLLAWGNADNRAAMKAKHCGSATSRRSCMQRINDERLYTVKSELFSP